MAGKYVRKRKGKGPLWMFCAVLICIALISATSEVYLNAPNVKSVNSNKETEHTSNSTNNKSSINVSKNSQEPSSNTTRTSNTTHTSKNNSSVATQKKQTCIECGKSASKTYVNPFSGLAEDYCYTHYQEIIDIMRMMESDVGKSSQSKHTCVQCSKEGTHCYNSFTGQTEYYCTQHYEELKDLLNALGLN